MPWELTACRGRPTTASPATATPCASGRSSPSLPWGPVWVGPTRPDRPAVFAEASTAPTADFDLTRWSCPGLSRRLRPAGTPDPARPGRFTGAAHARRGHVHRPLRPTVHRRGQRPPCRAGDGGHPPRGLVDNDGARAYLEQGGPAALEGLRPSGSGRTRGRSVHLRRHPPAGRRHRVPRPRHPGPEHPRE